MKPYFSVKNWAAEEMDSPHRPPVHMAIAEGNKLWVPPILFGVQNLCKNLQIKHVLIMTENTTALACINKQGLIKSRSCNKMALALIWDFAMEQGFWFSATHCPGNH